MAVVDETDSPLNKLINLPESYYGYSNQYQAIETKEKRSFSGGIFSVGLNYMF